MKWIRDILAVVVGVAGLLLMILGFVNILAAAAATAGAVLFVGGLILSGTYAIADKLDRLEAQVTGSRPAAKPGPEA
ncbi:MAG: hypothetical protein ACYTF6_11535 [Planctomycetota bacterium]|jgi:uncharacterized membrane protein